MKSVAVDVFAGAGGISEGLSNAGFTVKYANEKDPMAAATYKFNHPETTMDVRKIEDVRIEDILEISGAKVKLVAGGPPCQGFSMLGKRNPHDPRSMLVKEFVRIVNGVEPKFFLMENVPGIKSISGGKLFDWIISSLSTDYHVSSIILNAADFGVPQNRKRIFIFGSRNRNKSISKYKFRKQPPISVKEAISDLDFLKNGDSSNTYIRDAESKYQEYMRKSSSELHNHVSSRHNKSVVQRFSAINPGTNMSSLPIEMQIKKRMMYRLLPNELAKTITTLPDDYIHYASDRILTVREMARLQSFRDSYVFLGKRTTGGRLRKRECPQFTQVGNAVPPLVTEAIGEWILG